LIELRNVTKIYPGQTVPVVKDLTLKIEEGETCIFVGPSGCGKSTILRMINRMIEQTSGTILINNKDIRETDPDRLRMGIGYVIQQIGLLPHRTIAENIAIVPRLYGWDKERIRKRVDELLELVDWTLMKQGQSIRLSSAVGRCRGLVWPGQWLQTPDHVDG